MSSFDDISAAYDGARIIPQSAYERLKSCLADSGILKTGDKVADVGCGTGRFIPLLSDACGEVTGIDISPRMLAIAGEKTRDRNNATMILGNATGRLDVPNEYFDTAFSSKLLIHLEEWRKAVREIWRITKNEGYFVHVNESGLFNNSVRRKFRSICVKSNYPSGFRGEVDYDQITVELAKNGCELISPNCEPVEWDHEISHRKAFREIESHSFAEFNSLSDNGTDRFAFSIWP